MKKNIYASIAYIILVALTIKWPMLPLLLLAFISGFFKDAKMSFKEGVMLFAALIAFEGSALLINSDYVILGALILTILTSILIYITYYIKQGIIKADRDIQSRQDEIVNLFGEDYLQYEGKSNEEIKAIKDADYRFQKSQELTPTINNFYCESPINSLFDTFFVLDDFVYIAGLSHGYKEPDVKKYIKDRKLSYNIDNKAQYIIDYTLEEEGASNGKITVRIDEDYNSVDLITFTADLQTYSDIEERLDQYINLLLKSTKFKLRSDAIEDKSAFYCKYLTNYKDELYIINITIKASGNDSYRLMIELGASTRSLTYYSDEKYTLQTKGSAKERIRNHYLTTQQENVKQEDTPIKNESCYVYLMIDTTNNFYKIGISNNPEYRERTLQSEKPTIEKVCAKEYPHRKIAESIEKALHQSFASKRIRGEWFNLDENEVDMIKQTLK